MVDFQGFKFVFGVTPKYYGQLRERVRVLYLLFALSSLLCLVFILCNGASVRIPPRPGLSTYKKPLQ